ncbi:MAG: hypothetical protein IJW16_01565 [Clostridia bacterium]|nr:hypothetical protein [Clostridia bacterium]
MKKNLKICVEALTEDEQLCLVDMNDYDRIERSGMRPDPVHRKSAHMSGAWHFSDRARVSIDMDRADLTAYRYLTFSVYSVRGAGSTFSLFFDSSEGADGSNGYECTLTVAHDGWNDYRIELPFMRAWRNPLGWDHINSIDLDCVRGGQSNSMEAVLCIDSIHVWKQMAPPLYTTMPELKGTAAFALCGQFAIVNRRRVALSIDDATVRPFEEKGIKWIPMGAIATVMAHTAVADNKAETLSFTYRRKKYVFEANSAMMQVDGIRQTMTFAPIARDGILFFPADFVREFFRWRQIFTDPTGLIIFSNRKNIFDPTRDAARIRQLIADLTFLRPTGEEMVEALHKKIKNPTRGRVLATFDELMALRKLAKSDEAFKAQLNAFKAAWSGEAVSVFAINDDKSLAEALEISSKKLLAWSVLFRLTGDKQYCERVAEEAEALAALSDWRSANLTTLATVSLGISVAYDWCHHAWSEARKAVVERAILRQVLRPAVDAYNGRRNTWDMASAVSAQINAGFLAAALALADIYPETTLKIFRHVLRNAEAAMDAFSPDGGYAEGAVAWETGICNMALLVRMLETAFDDDYGFFSMPGFASSANFATYAETDAGAWNYHNCTARALDTSILSYFTQKTGKELYAWLRRRELIAGKKALTPWDLLFYTPVDATKTYDLPLDAVYRRAGIASMRADWKGEGMILGVHGGKNNERDGDLDAGSFILECAGERFFAETGGNEAIPMLTRRRAEGQNTLVIDPTEGHIPDQLPGAVAPIVEMKCSEARAYAIVDMTSTNDKFTRAKRGVMLTEDRTVAVIQDEAVLASTGIAMWHAYTPAEVVINKSGRVAKLTLNGKTMICRLAGVGSPARFMAETVGESGLSHLSVRVDVKERLRMAVVCYMEREGESLNIRHYEMTPMSKWGE